MNFSCNVTELNLTDLCANFTEANNSLVEGFIYSNNEKLIMAFITGSSNFVVIPGIVMTFKLRNDFDIFISLLTFLASFMYHVCDGLDMKIYMKEGKWHVLDNIGSICAINSMIVDIMNISRRTKNKLMFLNLFVVLLLQFADPWNIINTITPIVVYSLLAIYINFFKHPRAKSLLNTDRPKIITHGLYLVPFSIIFFILGLDEHTDYLRIYHSIWHILIGYSTFYLKLLNYPQEYTEYSDLFLTQQSHKHILNYLNPENEKA